MGRCGTNEKASRHDHRARWKNRGDSECGKSAFFCVFKVLQTAQWGKPLWDFMIFHDDMHFHKETSSAVTSTVVDHDFKDKAWTYTAVTVLSLTWTTLFADISSAIPHLGNQKPMDHAAEKCPSFIYSFVKGIHCHEWFHYVSLRHVPCFFLSMTCTIDTVIQSTWPHFESWAWEAAAVWQNA